MKQACQEKHKLSDVIKFRTKLATVVLVCGLSLGLLAACGRATDIFPPIEIGVATVAPTILDTPAVTATDLPATPALFTSTPTPTVADTVAATITPASTTTEAPLVIIVRTPSARQRTPAANRLVTPGTGTPRANVIVGRRSTPNAQTPVRTAATVITATPADSASSIFRNYLAIIVSQRRPTPSPTSTVIPTERLAPMVLTNTPQPTATPTPTSGTSTITPTPFVGTVRLLERDPVDVKGVIPAVAYADPNNVLAKDWSSFYAEYPTNSSFVRLYASESSRVFGPALALTDPTQWAEGVCMVPSTLVGVQFWGDDNDGWARVLVDGIPRWEGNTYGQSPTPFVRFLEISGLSNAPHVIRIEPTGQKGINLPSGNDHVSIYAVVCGVYVETEIFVPLLQR